MRSFVPIQRKGTWVGWNIRREQEVISSASADKNATPRFQSPKYCLEFLLNWLCSWGGDAAEPPWKKTVLCIFDCSSKWNIDAIFPARPLQLNSSIIRFALFLVLYVEERRVCLSLLKERWYCVMSPCVLGNNNPDAAIILLPILYADIQSCNYSESY